MTSRRWVARLDEQSVRALIRTRFADLPEPLPRWVDVRDLLNARRKGCELRYVGFEEKRAFDPRRLAERIIAEKLGPLDEQGLLAEVWATQPACAVVYKDDERAFRDEVGRERTQILNATIARPETDPTVTKIVPKAPPAAWPPGSSGRPLEELLDAVESVKRHFPAGTPMLGDLRWMTRAVHLWGFYRFEDKHVALNPVLNSPDVPRFVVEFVLFHELLHADMPSAGHNADFRDRERKFLASPKAVEEAVALGVAPSKGSPSDFWRVRAEMFLDTFERYFQWKKPGTGGAIAL